MQKDDDGDVAPVNSPLDQKGDPAENGNGFLEEEADDGDWLESDDEYSALPAGKAESMASKDTSKVQNKLYDVSGRRKENKDGTTLSPS